jgi:archaeosine synthase
MPQGPLTAPPFYDDSFEEAFRFILDDYRLAPRNIAIFIPCALKKPYSSSPSHRLFRKVISSVLSDEVYQVFIFGTCGVVPAELECMYPFAHYQYMLGKCPEPRIRQDFLEIETERLSLFLRKNECLYTHRIAYCIGIFRDAMEQASLRSGISLDLLLPTRPTIERLYDIDCPFPEGSLSMQEYISEFRDGLAVLKERIQQNILPPSIHPDEHTPHPGNVTRCS